MPEGNKGQMPRIYIYLRLIGIDPATMVNLNDVFVAMVIVVVLLLLLLFLLVIVVLQLT